MKKFILFRFLSFILWAYMIYILCVPTLLFFLLLLLLKCDKKNLHHFMVKPIVLYFIIGYVLIINKGELPYIGTRYNITNCNEFFYFLEKIWNIIKNF